MGFECVVDCYEYVVYVFEGFVIEGGLVCVVLEYGY